MSNKKISLKIDTYTWEKDNYELFDYETKQFLKTTHETSKTGELIRFENEVNYVEEDPKQKKINTYIHHPETQNLLSIYQGDDLYIKPPLTTSIWQVVPTQDEPHSIGSKISKDDVIKLGKKTLTITQIKDIDSTLGFHYHDNSKKISTLAATFLSENANDNDQINENEERTNQLCRICLSHSTQKTNPLISPCCCSGSTRWIHYECLKHWISSIIQYKITENMCEINQKAVKCEICKSYFPPDFEVQGEIFQLFDFGVNFKRYVMIEDKEGPLYIINFENKNVISVGRGHDCDFKIGEITVSRQHMEMRLENSSLYLKDKRSKFGSLVKIRDQKKIPLNIDLQFQCGRTLIKIRRKNIIGFMESVFGLCCSVGQTEKKSKSKKNKGSFNIDENN